MWEAARLADALESGVDSSLLIEDMAQAWFSPLRPTDGLPSSEIAGAAVPVPTALRTFYAQAGRRHDLATDTDPMVMPLELEVQADMVPFWYENQGVVAWAYALADGDHGDPPVYVTDHRTGWTNVAEARWVRETDRMGSFLLEMTVFRAMRYASGGTGGGWAFVDGADELDELVRRWTRIGGDWHWPSYPTRFYGGRDTIVHAYWPEGGSQGELWIQTRSDAAWEVFDQLPVASWDQWWPEDRPPRRAQSR